MKRVYLAFALSFLLALAMAGNAVAKSGKTTMESLPARDRPPTEEQALQLNAFQAWIAGRLDLSTLNIVLEPAMPIQLLLAEASRPAPTPEYITVESFLENNRTSN